MWYNAAATLFKPLGKNYSKITNGALNYLERTGVSLTLDKTFQGWVIKA